VDLDFSGWPITSAENSGGFTSWRAIRPAANRHEFDWVYQHSKLQIVRSTMNEGCMDRHPEHDKMTFISY
jgi:hypothetical protein